MVVVEPQKDIYIYIYDFTRDWHFVESLGGGFKFFLALPLFGEMIQFDDHIVPVRWVETTN